MTVILGINLSNRVYVAGDSRLSYMDSGELRVRHDNMQKVESLANSGGIVIASAGDAKFAHYMLSKMKNPPFAKSTISEVREHIVEWLAPIVDEYFKSNAYSHVTFILSGADMTSKKKISGDQFRNLARAYVGEYGVLKIGPHITEVIKEGEKLTGKSFELNINNTMLFSVEISQNGIFPTDANWGEILIYGPAGLVKEAYGFKEVGTLEFGDTISDNGSGVGNDIALTNAFIYSAAEKYNLDSVGGSVITMTVLENGKIEFLTGDIFSADIAKLKNHDKTKPFEAAKLNSIDFENGRFYRGVNGTKYRMYPVSMYKPTDKSTLYI